MTISFFFEGKRGNVYGVTCAHIARRSDETLHVLTSDVYDHKARCYPMKEIGRVVSYSSATDSCVFKVNGGIQVQLNTIRVAQHETHTLDFSSIPTFYAGIELCLFGAQRRGMNGKTQGCAEETMRDAQGVIRVLENDAMIQDEDGLPLTHAGNCGAVAIDRDGNPVAVHHAIEVVPIRPLISFIPRRPHFLKKRRFNCLIPFQRILDAHRDCFDVVVEDVTMSQQTCSSPVQKNSTFLLGRNFFRGRRKVKGGDFFAGKKPYTKTEEILLVLNSA